MKYYSDKKKKAVSPQDWANCLPYSLRPKKQVVEQCVNSL